MNTTDREETMAFYVHIKPRMLGSFSVSEPVGRSRTGRLAANQLEDVMLVQWLLTRLVDPKITFLGPPMVVDGDYGPQTDYHLCRFMTLLPSWLRGYTGKLGFPLVLDPENDTVIRPIYDSGNLNSLMQRLGEISEGEFPHLLKTMPRRLRDQIQKNHESWPK
jgi:hypothetical protein